MTDLHKQDKHLAADEAERAMLAELHAAAPAELRERVGLEGAEVDGAFVSAVTDDPSIVLNRTAGLGVTTLATRDGLRRIRALYETAGVGRHFVQLHPDARPEALRDWLRQVGYQRQRRWMKFVRGRADPPRPHCDLEVREIGAEHAAEFGCIVAEGFGLTAAGGDLLAALAGRPTWHLYITFAGDDPAGAAALFIHGKTGWLDWAATVPSQRRRGSQSALLARRIADALALGCETLFTITGEWVEGDPQHSYKNIQRAGFQEMCLYDNFAPAPR